MSRSVRKTQLMCHFFKLFSLSIKEAQLPNIDGVFGFWIKSPSCKPGQCYFLLLLGKKNFHYSSFSYSTLLPLNLLVEILFYGCSKWLQSLHQTCACTGALVVFMLNAPIILYLGLSRLRKYWIYKYLVVKPSAVFRAPVVIFRKSSVSCFLPLIVQSCHATRFISDGGNNVFRDKTKQQLK